MSTLKLFLTPSKRLKYVCLSFLVSFFKKQLPLRYQLPLSATTITLHPVYLVSSRLISWNPVTAASQHTDAAISISEEHGNPCTGKGKLARRNSLLRNTRRRARPVQASAALSAPTRLQGGTAMHLLQQCASVYPPTDKCTQWFMLGVQRECSVHRSCVRVVTRISIWPDQRPLPDRENAPLSGA